MKKQLLYTSLVLLIGYTALAQNKEAIKFSQTINKDNAYKHLSVLASDEYEGRETGKKGGWMAADYIKAHFKNLGLKGPVKGDYFQPIDMVTYGLSQVLTIEGQPAEPLKDFYVLSPSVSDKGFAFNSSSVLFAGYGLSKEGYNDYEGLNVAGKVVMIFKSGDPSTSSGSKNSGGNLNTKIKFLSDNKAQAVLVIDPMVDAMPGNFKSYLQAEQLVMKTKENLDRMKGPQSIPVIYIRTGVANQLLKSSKTTVEAVKKQIAESDKPASQELKIAVTASAKKTETKVRAENVLGFLEGSDPKLKNEVLVITAHYDHIGITPNVSGDDKINNGADDDGSGTTGVLMIAEAFAKAKKAGKGPKRSILFMTVTGEEKGLLGSEWYSEYPVFPLENTIADLNIDMIGRGDKEHASDNNFVYIIGSDMLSSDLDRIGKKANKDYVKMNLDERYNNRTDPNRFYYRSDHYNFAKHGIPVIFYFNGVHEDYHQPGDEISKIDFPMLAKRARLVYFTAWELANGAKRPVVDKNEDGTKKK
ncbi:MAG: M28 family peptidase [Candidatus Pedobacter colombiensis]|uniref:M28 family peptidase n=1 Tax=Candidatus Pedobacter colombiensis TaxID=3121371 RepID=A0AAJ5W8C0_9SPHI|nr:M28 family peptidase [Pedobacter sp.]WEK18899.1 MAG: M28 family peptidase [Pedobacter sp.]